MNQSSSKSSSRALSCYVGVTGVNSAQQVAPLIASAAAHGIGAGFSYALMLGCLVSPTLERHLPPIHTAKPHRHVGSLDILSDTLSAARQPGCIGMLHFELSKEWPAEAGQAKPVVSLLQFLATRSLYPAVQLNGVLWAEDIIEISKESGVPIVLQLRKELAERGEADVLRYIDSVASAISMVLFDPSAGAGHALDIGQAVTMHRAIEQRFPGSFTFGYAGGLGGTEQAQLCHTTEVVKSLAHTLQSSQFSVDAETRIRRPGAAPDTDELDVVLCSRYFAAVMEGLRSPQ